VYLKNSNETKNKIHKSISRGTFLYSPQTTTNASLQPTNPKPQGLLHSTTHLRTRSYSHHFTPISPSTEFRSGPHHFSRRPLARASHRNLPHTRERQSTLRFAPSNRPIESRVQMGLLRVLQPDLRTLSFEARKKNPNIKDVRDRDAAALLDRQTDRHRLMLQSTYQSLSPSKAAENAVRRLRALEEQFPEAAEDSQPSAAYIIGSFPLWSLLIDRH